MAKAAQRPSAAPADSADVDGRSARAGRTREAIVDALFALLEDGHLQPTGDQIAERAGVSLRSVFLHFQSREQLFAAITERQAARIAPLFGSLDQTASLEARIDAFVDQRARVLEALTPLRRAAVLMEPRSELVAHKLAGVRAGKRAQAEWLFERELAAHLADERAALAAALGAACDWNAWQSWRLHQELDPAAAREAMRVTLRRLLGAESIAVAQPAAASAPTTEIAATAAHPASPRTCDRRCIPCSSASAASAPPIRPPMCPPMEIPVSTKLSPRLSTMSPPIPDSITLMPRARIITAAAPMSPKTAPDAPTVSEFGVDHQGAERAGEQRGEVERPEAHRARAPARACAPSR